VRALAPFIAGSSGLAYRRFVPYSVVGTGLWATLFCTLGYLFWRSFDKVAHLVGQAIFGLGLTVALIVGVVVAYRRRQAIGNWFAAHERHPLVRPLLAVGRPLHRRVVRPVTHVAMPYLRFLFDRISPGGLGLELTTLLAIAGVGLFVFVAYLTAVDHNAGPTPLDAELLDLGDRLRTDTLVDVAKVVTALGAFPTVAALVIAASVLLIVRRRYAEVLVLVLGFTLVYLAVNVTKDVVARPRPDGPFVGTWGHAYPSGHAAYATAWVAVAVALTRRLRLVASGALVFIGLAVAVAVGVSRVYLRAHWASDVWGAIGLGAGIFALLAAIALVVEYIRHNGGGREDEQYPPLQH
jgi:undecaprenyl-diphosphatase